jgi:hypothetical protein
MVYYHQCHFTVVPHLVMTPRLVHVMTSLGLLKLTTYSTFNPTTPRMLILPSSHGLDDPTTATMIAIANKGKPSQPAVLAVTRISADAAKLNTTRSAWDEVCVPSKL